MINKIAFKGTKVSKLSLDIETSENLQFSDKYKLSIGIKYPKEKNKTFIVTFFCYISSEKERFEMQVEYSGIFKTEEKITEEFKNSHFPSVNAPAIAYPFLRSFVNTIAVNANLKPVILPTINFQELAKQKEQVLMEEE